MEFERVRCCFCARSVDTGIWVRANPEEVMCHGKDGVHEALKETAT